MNGKIKLKNGDEIQVTKTRRSLIIHFTEDGDDTFYDTILTVEEGNELQVLYNWIENYFRPFKENE